MPSEMAEGDPKPTPADPAAPKAGGWKAVLKDGRNVIVHEIELPPGEVAGVAVKVKRLTDNRHPALAPILAWGTDATGMWVAVEPNEGTPLNAILKRGPFKAPTAAVLATSVLSGVAAMHQAGISMGGFDASAVKVNGNGDVRLVGHQAAIIRPAPSQADLRADVRSAGAIICAAFGVDPEGAAAPPDLNPGLVVNIRSMAGGAVGPSAERALGSFRETTGNLLSASGQAAATSELAMRQSGRESPSITPFITKSSPTLPAQYLEPVVEAAEPPAYLTAVPAAASPEAPPAPAAQPPATTTAPRPAWTPQPTAPRLSTVPRRTTRPPAESSGRPSWQVPAYIALIVLVIAGLGAGAYFVTRPQSGTGPSANVTPSAKSSAKPSPSPSPKISPSPSTSVPKPVPTYAPSAAGAVKSVAIDPANTTCTLGGPCTVEVDVFFAVGQADVAWSFKVFNRCTGTTDDLPGTHVNPHADWIEVIGDANLNLPSGLKSAAIVAITTTPAQAASKEFLLGASTC